MRRVPALGGNWNTLQGRGSIIACFRSQYLTILCSSISLDCSGVSGEIINYELITTQKQGQAFGNTIQSSSFFKISLTEYVIHDRYGYGVLCYFPKV